MLRIEGRTFAAGRDLIARASVVTIRKTLLAAFLAIGVGASILLTALGFVKAREALRAEIDRNVLGGAEALAAEIDRTMFERVQNASVWSRLDVMQDIAIRDIDKRVSQFLADLQRGYRNVYVSISCIDTRGRIVASSDSALIGTEAAAATPWLVDATSGAALALPRDRAEAGADVLIDVPVHSTATGEAIGTLRLDLDGSPVDDLLDRAANEKGRVAFIVDAGDRLVAASRALRASAARASSLAGWREDAGRVRERSGAPLVDASVIAGAARASDGARLRGLGWTVIVAQPVAEALEPIHRMAAIFLLLVAAIALLTATTALWISHAIASPVVSLTKLARAYMQTRVLESPPSRGVGEVRELSDAFVRMVRDIDQSRQNLVRASKLAVVGEMSSVIAHEVRTPLGIMRSSAQLLRREPQLSEEGRELAGFIESETDRLNRLVSSMLDSARPRAPVHVDVDIHALLRRTVALLGAQLAARDIDVRLSTDARDAIVECDEEQMTQVILNILLNALQILRPGGRVEVSTLDAGSELRIDIADDGPGIPEHERGHVFDAFFFRREGGVGLGLAIVQQIVHAHGGTIEAGRSALSGALFRISLPRTQRSAA